ncbi:DUF2802 domain-containing protein [Rhodocyclus gracilis]|uniref:DUF2802 domain-containing protein n=1 Tax=Rhodocyclus tenuis TaxID=1066 RepID=A0A6L5K0P1_RHOTE|nr:DUF2802 domain-containing protein [Rhodocyclus gracilis]MQY52474.1 DUF2802 domain-containing protein [Rhodocyclus gracilis]
MNPEVFASLSWRDALVGLVVLLAVYVGFVFLRMRALQRAPATSPVTPAAAGTALAAYAAVAEEPSLATPAPPAKEEPAPAAPTRVADFAWNEPPPLEPADRRDVEALEREAARLRNETAALRERVGLLDAELSRVRITLQDDITALRDELRREMEQASVTQHVSPLYGEAMQMALQGADALDIARRCGIARAEAELVVALTRNHDEAP